MASMIGQEDWIQSLQHFASAPEGGQNAADVTQQPAPNQKQGIETATHGETTVSTPKTKLSKDYFSSLDTALDSGDISKIAERFQVAAQQGENPFKMDDQGETAYQGVFDDYMNSPKTPEGKKAALKNFKKRYDDKLLESYRFRDDQKAKLKEVYHARRVAKKEGAFDEAKTWLGDSRFSDLNSTTIKDRAAVTTGYLKDRFTNGVKNLGTRASNFVNAKFMDDADAEPLRKTKSIQDRILDRKNDRIIGALDKDEKAAAEKYLASRDLYNRIKNYDPEYIKKNINEKTAAAAREQTLANRRAKASNISKLGWKGKGLAAVGLVALGGVISNMFSGGKKSNAELYNPNPQPQYYS